MKTFILSRLFLVGAILAASFPTISQAADDLTLTIDSEGVVRRDDKVISMDALKALAKEQASKHPGASVTVITEDGDDDDEAKPALDVLRAAIKKVSVREAASADGNTDATTSSIRFSDPSKPGTLKVVVANGDIRINGGDSAEIVVRTELKPEGATHRKDGLRVLTSSSSYSLTEKDNIATLSYGTESWPNGGGEFDITVPRNTGVVISNAYGGNIEIRGVTGNLEVKSLNGEVHLTDIAGGALVETMNGEIQADVRAINDSVPLSFTSMNGGVSLRLPTTIKANVRLRTHNGTILTDFDEKQLVTKTVAAKATRGAQTIHGGGSNDGEEIRATVREAVRMGMDAAREAARGAREAMSEARGESGNESDDEPHIPLPPMAPLPPMTGGKIVTGTLNGGGPEIRITTMNGDVTLRKVTTK